MLYMLVGDSIPCDSKKRQYRISSRLAKRCSVTVM